MFGVDGAANDEVGFRMVVVMVMMTMTTVILLLMLMHDCNL